MSTSDRGAAATSGVDDTLVVALRMAAQDLTGRRSIRELETTLSQIVAAAVATIPGVAAASISLTEDGQVTTRYPTGETVRDLDELQSRVGEGPCISAIEAAPSSGLVVAQDLAGSDADRWPTFAPHVLAAGFRGLMSTQLSSAGGPRAALNLYAVEPDAFDDNARTVAGLFGVQAALVLYGTTVAGQLQRAVDSRDLIGQAKGILMERFSVDSVEAFGMLVRSSQETNVKLISVAQWLVDQPRGTRDGE